MKKATILLVLFFASSLILNAQESKKYKRMLNNPNYILCKMVLADSTIEYGLTYERHEYDECEELIYFNKQAKKIKLYPKQLKSYTYGRRVYIKDKKNFIRLAAKGKVNLYK